MNKHIVLVRGAVQLNFSVSRPWYWHHKAATVPYKQLSRFPWQKRKLEDLRIWLRQEYGSKALGAPHFINNHYNYIFEGESRARR
jgi:hypothetical protein